VAGQGKGLITLAAAAAAAAPTNATQGYSRANGSGTLEAARGSHHVVANGSTISGEQDVRGAGFSSAKYSNGVANKANWSGMSWSGMSWSGMSWSGMSWSGMSWSGMSWSGMSWSGMSWS
jgi:serine protease AprX